VTLQARKQQRAKTAIVEAAFALFEERGFDQVTVTEIAERAEVGRTTFFRYFGDKQEVLFAERERDFDDVLAQIRGTAEARAPIGDAVGDSLDVVRDAVREGRPGWTDSPERSATLTRLLHEHPDLQARHLLKQQQQADAVAEVLVEHGATRGAAVLAIQLGLACLQTALRTASDPLTLSAEIDAAFARLETLPRRSGSGREPAPSGA
jgi:AcrR family transcriptional regulator